MRPTTLMMTSPFRYEFEEVTKPHRNVRGRLFADHVRIEVHKVNSEEYRLTWLFVEERFRRKGLATQAIEWLCDLADAHNIKLVLSPLGDPDEHALTTIQLTAWYQKFGFFRIGMQDEMKRLPNGKR
jgi:GNAT superfamily N-acetyltransferase